jgi:hypothetical protein
MKKNFVILLLLVPLIAFSQNISIANTSVPEGNGGQQTVEIMVVVSPMATAATDISYTTRNGTASSGSDYSAANGIIHFTKGETTKKIRVVVNGDIACEPNESFEIVLSHASGALITDGTGTVSIINDDCLGATGPAMYEIRLTCTGYTTFSAGPPDCPVRTNGKVILYGIVQGNEQVASDDDINYRGTMQLDMDMDICSILRENGEDKFCVMTATGSGPVDVELEVQFDQRGGYIKMENKTGRYARAIKGSCEQAEMNEELTMIPNKTIASIFNGLELPSLTNRTLTVGTYHVGQGTSLETVIEVIRKIR